MFEINSNNLSSWTRTISKANMYIGALVNLLAIFLLNVFFKEVLQAIVYAFTWRYDSIREDIFKVIFIQLVIHANLGIYTKISIPGSIVQKFRGVMRSKVENW